MDKFLEAYMKWPAVNQTIFATLVTFLGSVLFVIAAWWLMVFLQTLIKHITICIKGWPPEPIASTLAPIADSTPQQTVVIQNSGKKK